MGRGGGGGGGGKGGGKKAGAGQAGHTIHPDEVEAFTKGSVIGGLVIHRTYQPAADDLMKNGIDLNKARGVYGEGLYTSTGHEKAYGPVAVHLALNVRNPLVGSSDQLHAKFREWGGGKNGFDPVQFSAMARARGHDAIVTGWHGLDPHSPASGGTKWVVVTNPSAARVVIPRRSK